MDKWEELKKWIQEHRAEHIYSLSQSNNVDGSPLTRYCVAISCDDLLEKMYELEEKS